MSKSARIHYGFKVWFLWFWVGLKNFPFYTTGRTSSTKFLVFWRTGHCLHFNNPLGRLGNTKP